MKKVLGATLALALGLAVGTPAAGADPTRGAASSAFGLSVTVLGSQLLGPTPTVSASQPPGESNTDRTELLGVPLGPVAVAAVASVTADAHRNSDVRVTLRDPAGIPGDSDPTALDDVNARGLARTTGLGVVVQGPIDVPGIGVIPVPDLIGQTLAGASVVTAEAVAKCVNDVPQFDYGYDLVGVGLLSQKVDLVDDLLVTIGGLLAGEGEQPAPLPIEDLIHIHTPELNPRGVGHPDAVVQTANGISVTALRVHSPLLGVDIPVSHAVAEMARPCGIAPPPVTGEPRPPAPSLAATGDDMGTWPLLAFGVLGGAVLVRRTMVRSYRRAS